MVDKSLFCVSCVVLIGCARSPSTPTGTVVPISSESAPPSCVALTRGEWFLEWSAYVARESALDGKPLNVYSPAPGARRVMRDADVTPPTGPGQGALVLGMGSKPTIFDAAQVRVDVGDVVEREVSRDRVASACVTGANAKVYWSKAHEKTRSAEGKTTREPFSKIFIEGASVGEGTLELRLSDGTVKTVAIVVATGSPEP